MDERPGFKSYDPTMSRTLRPYPENTVLDLISETARERPDHPALIFKGTRLTYARLARLTDAFGSDIWSCAHSRRLAFAGLKAARCPGP